MRIGPLQPPRGGEPAPTTATLEEEQEIDLSSLAIEICQRYRREFPDERERYGDAGTAWCVHDNQYLLSWAAETLNGTLDMKEHVAWLVRVLSSRNFPITRLARGLEIAAETVLDRVESSAGQRFSAVLSDAALFVLSPEVRTYRPQQ